MKLLFQKISKYIDIKWGWFLTNGMKQKAREERLLKEYKNEKY